MPGDATGRPPSRVMRVAGHPATWVMVIALAFAVPFAARRSHPLVEPLPVLGALPAFALLDQDGAPYDLARLEGRPTVANFIFTSCPTVCPLQSARMAGLVERTRGLDARFVSFSVDPETDTPAVLKAYGARFHQDPARWTFVTGPREAIERTVVEGFRVAVSREKRDAGPGPDIWDIVHGEHFVLVDAEGRLRGYYLSDDAGLDRLVRDLGGLAGGVGMSQRNIEGEAR